MVSELDQEPLYLILKKNHEHQKPYAHELVEDRTDQLELKYLRCEHPHHYEGEDSEEYVYGSALLHDPVKVKEEQSHYGYVEDVAYAELIHVLILLKYLLSVCRGIVYPDGLGGLERVMHAQK